MRLCFALLVVVICSCSAPPREEFMMYRVIDQDNRTVRETSDGLEATKLAEELNLEGRLLPSKPAYFVVEVK